MIKGGIPKGRIVIVCGGPGTGKTTLALQFLINGCTKHNEKGLFISLDESIEKIFEDSSSFGWNLQELHNKKAIVFIEELFQPDRKFSVDEFIRTIEKKAHEIGAQRIALDALTHLTIHFPDLIARRSAILRLFKVLSATDATCLIADEIGGSSDRVILLEEYLADGVIKLESSQVERGKVRTLEIEKMRGTPTDDQIRAYVIGENGIEVISEKDIFTFAASILTRKS